MTLHPYGLLLGLFVLFLLALDYIGSRRTGGRYFLLEVVGLGSALPFLLIPRWSQRVADLVHVGRGVDVLIYPLILWLVRESIVTRQRRFEDQQRITELVRQLAIRDSK